MHYPRYVSDVNSASHHIRANQEACSWWQADWSIITRLLSCNNLSLTRFSFFSKGIEHLVPLGLLPVDGRDVYEPLEQPAEDDTKIFDARASREEYHDFFPLFLKGDTFFCFIRAGGPAYKVIRVDIQIDSKFKDQLISNAKKIRASLYNPQVQH